MVKLQQLWLKFLYGACFHRYCRYDLTITCKTTLAYSLSWLPSEIFPKYDNAVEWEKTIAIDFTFAFFFFLSRCIHHGVYISKHKTELKILSKRNKNTKNPAIKKFETINRCKTDLKNLRKNVTVSLQEIIYHDIFFFYASLTYP